MHQTIVRRYTCQLYPTPAQAAVLSTRLDAACERYNATVRELYRAWAEPEYASAEQAPTAGPGDDVVHRAAQAFDAFILKHQHANAPGGPPFRARQHFVSITFLDWGACTRGGVDLPGVGPVATNKRRALPVRPMALTVKHRGHMWQACFSIRAD
jgi:hypothetical protein